MGLFAGISPKIIVVASPTHFVFSRPDKDFRISLGTFLFMLMDEKHGFVRPFSIGEEISEEIKRADPNIIRIDPFDSDRPIKAGVFDREDLMHMLVEYGLRKCLELSRFHWKPEVNFIGADRFSGTFQNPRKLFERILKSAGAGSIVFDQTDL